MKNIVEQFQIAVMTAHRIAKHMNAQESTQLYMAAISLAQEATGYDYSSIRSILQASLTRLEVRVELFEEKIAQWVEQLRRDIPNLQHRKEEEFVFVPVPVIREWARRKRVPIESLVAALKAQPYFWCGEENGVTRYSRRMRIEGEATRAYGFTIAWVQGEMGETQ